jgi:hypothetical protein
MCNLKTFLETGKPMPTFDMSEQEKVVAEMERILKEAPAAEPTRQAS